MVLTGKRLILRAMETEDLKMLHQWQNDEELMRLARSSPDSTISMEALRSEFEKVVKGEDPFRLVYVVEEKADGKPIGIGSITIHRWNRRTTAGDVGLFVAPKGLRNKGYGTEIVQLLLKESFEQLNLHRVGWWTFAENTASLGLAKKMGFREEARLRDNVFFDNKYHDSVALGLLKDEYEKHVKR